jgi:hypothetical protein
MQSLINKIQLFFEQINNFNDNQKIIALGLLGGLLAVLFAYRYLAILITLLHEFGHAFMAKVTFGKVYKIHLNSDTSGVTETTGGWRSLFILLSGYPSPLLFSGLFVWFLRLNHPEFVLFVLLFVSIFVLFVIRNWYGVLICLLGVILTGSLIYFGHSEVFTGIAGMLIAFLTLGAFRDVRAVFHHHLGPSDADLLHEKFTFIPAFVWKLVLLLLMFLALVPVWIGLASLLLF